MPDSRSRITFTVQANAGDIVWSAVELTRRSKVSLALGAGSLTLGLVALGVGAPTDLWNIYLLVFGAGLVTGLVAAPFQYLAVRRRPDLVTLPITIVADDDGMTITTAIYESRTAWALFRSIQETKHGYAFQSGVGSWLVPKRGLSDAERRAFAELIGQHAKVTSVTSLAFIVQWGLIGIALGFVPILVGLALG